VSSDSSQGYGAYTPPKNEKRHPLTRSDTENLYQTAREYPDREAELVVRVLLDFGLRIAELTHIRSHWINKEYHREFGGELWRIKVPKVEYCWGGKGEDGAGFQNSEGADLHTTSHPCNNCQDRNWQAKVAPLDDDDEPQPEKGWLTWDHAEEYDFAPKSARSATKVWALPSLEEMEETARRLKQFLEAQPHKQWPHGGNAVRNRLDKVVERGLPEDPQNPKPGDVVLPDRAEKKVVPHALRHTYGCRLVESSVNEGVGMKQMRHQNAEIFRWYADVRGSRVVSALTDAVSENDSLVK
jgi:integrase